MVILFQKMLLEYRDKSGDKSKYLYNYITFIECQLVSKEIYIIKSLPVEIE